MSSTTYRFIEPLDVLFLRGNKLFGDPGSHAESLVPPWPSVAAGALRSLMLTTDGFDPAAFARGEQPHPSLGTPTAPGSFTVTAFDLARRDAQGRVETLHALPADLVASRDETSGALRLTRIQPIPPTPGLVSSAPLPFWPMLPQRKRGKPVSGLWLTHGGWADHLAGRTPNADQLVASANLWAVDARIGVGLDPATRRADDGKLFTTQAVAMRPGVGFLAAVASAEPPRKGMLRLGGDGRGASLSSVEHRPDQTDLQAIARARRCRIVLTTPGLFAEGWRLPFVDAGLMWKAPGIRGRLVCAAVPRAETVSGWDLARREPKPAERAAPPGSVYWIDDLEATPDALRKLADRGLWPEADQNASRRAEGFNRFTFAIY